MNRISTQSMCLTRHISQQSTRLVFTALLLLPTVATIAAADSIRFSESLVQSPTKAGGDVTQGRTNISATVALSGATSGNFSSDTPVVIHVGDFHYATTLGADPQYAPGKTRAAFLSRGVSPSGVRNSSWVLLSWNSKRLLVTVSVATPGAFQSVLAATVIKSPGLVKSGATASIHVGPLTNQFTLDVHGTVTTRAVRIGEEIIEFATARLSGTGVPGTLASTQHVGEGKFHVDTQSGRVSIEGNSLTRAVLTGSAIRFTSSTLLDQPGDVGRRIMSVSFTNRSGKSIGMLPNGAVTGMKVLFSAFNNVGAFTSPAAQTVVSTVAGDGTAGMVNGPVASARFYQPTGVAVSSDGSVYVADPVNRRVRKIKAGLVSTLAGSGANSSVNGMGGAAHGGFQPRTVGRWLAQCDGAHFSRGQLGKLWWLFRRHGHASSF